jgi:C4-type Zn-finger protein
MITCPFCGGMNEATVRNELLRPFHSNVIGPVWQCNLCEEQWTDWEAEKLLQPGEA